MRRAMVSDIALRIPSARASYVALVTTERGESCATTAGLPRAYPLSRSSTEAKNASMSTCKMTGAGCGAGCAAGAPESFGFPAEGEVMETD